MEYEKKVKVEQLSLFKEVNTKPKVKLDNHVLHDGRMFYCPKCKEYLGETIYTAYKYCYHCGLRVNWNVWDQSKNELKKQYVRRRE